VGGGALAFADAGSSWFELGFVEVGGRCRREPLSGCGTVRFEDVSPVRAFRWSKGQRHFPGWWWSATMGGHVGFESWLERDHVMLLDFDPNVVAFASQPFWLHWSSEDGERRHAPDFFARQVDGAGVVVDVRAADRIEPADAEAFEVTGRACAEAGWAFRRVGVLDPVFTANVRWLSRYRHPRCAGPDGIAGRLRAVFADPLALLAGAAEVGDTLVVLPALFHLMWRQELVADLAAGPLRSFSLVHRAAGGVR